MYRKTGCNILIYCKKDPSQFMNNLPNEFLVYDTLVKARNIIYISVRKNI